MHNKKCPKGYSLKSGKCKKGNYKKVNKNKGFDKKKALFGSIGIIIIFGLLMFFTFGTENLFSLPSILLSFVFSVTIIVYFFNREDIGKELLFASIIAFMWVSFSGIYTYKESNISIFGFNLMAFIFWTGGLVLLKEIHEFFYDKEFNYFLRILFSSVIYWSLLISLEYIGFNILKIQLANDLPGLFGLPVIHVPTFAKFFYVLAGPTFLLFTDLLDIK